MKIKEILERSRKSRKLILVVVFFAILLDNILLTIIVPIIPEYLFGQDVDAYEKNAIAHLNESLEQNSKEPWLAYDKNFSANVLKLFGEEIPSRRSSDKRSAEIAVEDHEDGGVGDGKSDRQTLYTDTVLAEYEENYTNYKRETLNSQNVRVGIMFASKAIVQLITNPFVGFLTNRIGYDVPMFSGFIIMFASTIGFAYGTTYTVLLIARAIQGIGSSLSSVSGMSMIADVYPDNEERGSAMGIALSGLALGVLIGPPFGGFVYQFFGKRTPFLIIAFLALGNGFLQLFALKPKIAKSPLEGVSIFKLLKDPLILITAGTITIGNMGIAMLEPSLPLWMMSTMNAPKWQLGVAFLPASISYLIGTSTFGPMGHKFGRWLTAMIGMTCIGIFLTLIPQARSIKGLILPNAGLGLSIGMVDSSMMPTMGHLVDVRHVAVYGNVYAIADVAFCLGYALGPSISGTLVKHIKFSGMLYFIAAFNIILCPLLIYLRRFEVEEKRKQVNPMNSIDTASKL